MWRFIAGVCEAKVTASRRVGFVLLGIGLLGGQSVFAALPDHSWHYDSMGICPSNPVNEGSNLTRENPYCLTDLDGFPPAYYGSSKWGNLLDADRETGLIFPRAPHLTFSNLTNYISPTIHDLFVNCDLNTLSPATIPTTATWTAPSATTAGELILSPSPCGWEVDANLFRKLHFGNTLIDLNGPMGIFGSPVGSGTRKAIILIHGWNRSKAVDQYDNAEFKALVAQLQAELAGTEWSLILYHWEADSDTGGAFNGDGSQYDLIPTSISGTRAAEIAHQHGQHLGELLANLAPNLEKVHFIAHSAGSWVARSALRYLTTYPAQGSATISQITLLDPFIPAASGANSSLDTSAMNGIQVANGIYRLENYWAMDIALGTNNSVIWDSAIGVNKRVDIRTTGYYAYCSFYCDVPLPGDGHSQPIKFYADTIANTKASFIWGYDSTDVYRQQQYNLDNYGWPKSIFYNEPQVVQQPVGQTKYAGETASFATLANVRGSLRPDLLSGDLRLQWQVKHLNASWTNIPGATANQYTTPTLTASDHCSEYRVVVDSIVNTRSAGVDVSTPAQLILSGQGSCQGGGAGGGAVAPVIRSIMPISLPTSTGAQPLTILGSGFTSASTLQFTFNGSPVTALNDPRLISSTELKYDISVGTTPGQWGIRVANGGLLSQQFVFQAVDVAANVGVLPPAAPTGLVAFAGNWSQSSQFMLDWTNPSSANGITKVWWKIGSAPTSLTDGSVASINSAKPLQISLPVVEGQQDVYVWLEDGAGNRSHLNRATIRLGKDITPPGIAITTQLTANTTQSSVTLSGTFSDALSGVSRVTWSNNSMSSGDVSITPGLSGSWTMQPITLYGGDNYITVTAIDAAGNYTTRAVTIKKTDTTNSGSVMFTLSPPEAVTAGAKWRANGGVWHLSGEYELNVPAGVAQVDFQGAGNYVAPQSSPVIVTAGQVAQRTASFPLTVINVPPYTPSNPYPANGTMGLSRVNPSFSWTGGGPVGGVDYHFMLGNTSSPEISTLCAFGFGAVAGSSVTCLRTLNSGTTYYWKVAARDATGAITNSPVWSFTTEYAMPDLIVSNVVLNGNVAPGASVTADVTVQNIGNFPSYGASYVHVYLSSSPGGKNVRLTPNVPNNVPVLQPGQTQTFSIPVTLTGLQSGTSYLDAWIDSTQAGQVEGNVNNNLRSIPLSY